MAYLFLIYKLALKKKNLGHLLPASTPQPNAVYVQNDLLWREIARCGSYENIQQQQRDNHFNTLMAIWYLPPLPLDFVPFHCRSVEGSCHKMLVKSKCVTFQLICGLKACRPSPGLHSIKAWTGLLFRDNDC